METNAHDRLLNESQAAEMLGVSRVTLNAWRRPPRRTDLPYVKLGKRFVRYRESDLRAFITKNLVTA